MKTCGLTAPVMAGVGMRTSQDGPSPGLKTPARVGEGNTFRLAAILYLAGANPFGLLVWLQVPTSALP
jgi:hypothetical protein